MSREDLAVLFIFFVIVVSSVAKILKKLTLLHEETAAKLNFLIANNRENYPSTSMLNSEHIDSILREKEEVSVKKLKKRFYCTSTQAETLITQVKAQFKHH
ncbi:hypothetical protein AMS58_16365 [Pseudoalteromonas porphyrae]|uniref:hypothetical protein n=1 Tax=Pseudoalteromonas TaxID=53246 RepID=UPI0006BB1EB7|nr:MULTISPECIES: hypothetical protein [Pseudoalteromonas]KPH93629.1 hypothetical protein AMS58_16365 [Pseudoalteromonas porphyrae]